ncbi:hypothetical protein EU508_13465 [Pseudoalteromonas fuliginea]|uniref:Uncharacterized protein n=1 Tax=Pseudoalteromonas fuliginea TaxID=1872678 RepID=A0AB73BEC8_9GAMM|nr:hypothetical protein EU508_13465 [Pseudoalteromonas fuliginea]
MIFKFIFSSQRFLVNSTQLALKIAARDRFIIQSSGYLCQCASLRRLVLLLLAMAAKNGAALP